MNNKTLFQTAQEKATRIPHDFDPSVIVQLHEEPEPDYIDNFPCSFGDPESILIALEELESDLTLECIEQQLCIQNNTGRNYFDQIAPTTTNIQDKDKSPMAQACHEWRYV